MVPINFIERHYPNIRVHLWVPVFFRDYAKRCVTTKNIFIRDFTEAAKHWKHGMPTYVFGNKADRFNNLSCHMVDHAFFFLNFQPISIKDKNYPRVNLDGVKLPPNVDLPEKYAVVCTGFTTEVRELLPEHVNKISDYLVEQGITPVYLGNKAAPNGMGHVIMPKFHEEVDYSKGIDLLNQTSLLQAAKVIEGSKCLVGLDCGLHHIAGCTDVPIVMGFSSLLAEHRLPYRNGVLGDGCYPVELTDEENKHRGFQSKSPFAYNRNFTRFICDEERNVLKQLNADKYIEQIRKLL